MVWKTFSRCHESQLSSQSEPKKIPRLICHCMSQNWMLMVSCEQPLSPPRHPQNLTLQLPTFKGWPPKAKHLATSFPAPMAYQHASEEHLTSHKRCKSQRRCLELYLGDLGGKARVRHFQVPNRIPYVPWLWSLLLCVCVLLGEFFNKNRHLSKLLEVLFLSHQLLPPVCWIWNCRAAPDPKVMPDSGSATQNVVPIPSWNIWTLT